MKSINTITIIHALYDVKMLVFRSLSRVVSLASVCCTLFLFTMINDITNQSKFHQLVTQTREPMLEPSQPQTALPAAEATIHTTIAAESVKLLLFWPQEPEVWFTKVEVQFMTRSVSSQKTKLDCNVS